MRYVVPILFRVLMPITYLYSSLIVQTLGTNFPVTDIGLDKASWNVNSLFVNNYSKDLSPASFTTFHKRFRALIVAGVPFPRRDLPLVDLPSTF